VEGGGPEAAQVRDSTPQPLQAVRAAAFLYAPVPDVPHLLPQPVAPGAHPRGDEIELVINGRASARREGDKE
jgi:hypothetical protein